uniref:Agglutinin n=1 Tax=Marasmius oreades TaxID=181124 RepID=UPI0015E26F68|nr:Chain AAA, Agglutinin [Marasmius oreades]
MSLRRGIYHIENAGVPSAIDLKDGSSSDGTPIVGWQFTPDTINWHQLWLAEPIPNVADTFTLCNLFSGTYMDLYNGSSEAGTAVNGWQGTAFTTNPHQLWTIKKSSDGTSYKIQNYGSKTFVDLVNGDSSDGAKIAGWTGTWDEGNPHQKWYFNRMSVSSAEAQAAIARNPHIHGTYRGYILDGEYLVLPNATFTQIWKDSGLPGSKWREQIYDADDFAIAMKAAVGKWGADSWKANGFAIFCGVMLGVNKAGDAAAAYNFTLTKDHADIVFFEPQNGGYLNDIGYDSYMAFY